MGKFDPQTDLFRWLTLRALEAAECHRKLQECIKRRDDAASAGATTEELADLKYWVDDGHDQLYFIARHIQDATAHAPSGVRARMLNVSARAGNGENIAEDLASIAADVQNPPPATTPTAETVEETLPLDARAVSLLVTNPEARTWSITKIADTLGCHRGSLYDCELFQKTRTIMKPALPRGSKDKDGNLEAWEADE